MIGRSLIIVEFICVLIYLESMVRGVEYDNLLGVGRKYCSLILCKKIKRVNVSNVFNVIDFGIYI